MTTFVIVHGGWHTGDLMQDTARVIRDSGNDVHLPTLAGNAPGDSKQTGLEEAIGSVLDCIEIHNLEDFVLVGHSYAGMIITAIADRIPSKVRRLVYWNAFVPNDGESLNDMVPPHYVELFNELEKPDGSVSLPFAIWREAFINDASVELAQSAFDQLNPHPYKTFVDKLKLKTNPAGMTVPKSYLNATEDTALPQSLGWHPRLSEKLGVFRLVQMPGSHEICFTNPSLLGEKIMEAGRD
ncbi:MAG: pimeloyl-ACP methyl ester carboxylesterase [Gammaproteobacteria bacterium]|jgi:pimeloyl-ACP methyl ester carboxylesterase